MEWFSKVISVIKIPIKILLPALWLFSGALTLLNDNILTMLNLLEWKNQNGFIFGLTFSITSCLLIIYFVYYVKDKISNLIFKLTIKRKTMKRIFELNDTELSIVIMLYNSPGYSGTLDYNEPIIQGLLARNMIYSGSQQRVTMSAFDNAIPLRLTLQPFVYQALNHYKPILEKEIQKIKIKANNEKNTEKKAQLLEQATNMMENFNRIYSNGGMQR